MRTVSRSTGLAFVLGLALSPLFHADPSPDVVAVDEPEPVRAFELEVQSSDYEKAFELVKHSVFEVSGPDGHGTGFLIAPGYLLTNEHVVENNAHGHKAEPFVLPLPFTPPLLLLPELELRERHYAARCFSGSDEVEGKEFAVAPVVLADGTRARHRDLALLRIPPDVELCPEVRPIPIGTPRVGMPVMVIGNPAEEDVATFGRITKVKGVKLDETERLWKDVAMVATDAAINRGNSGGPILGLRRELVGGSPVLKIELVGIATWSWRGLDNLSGGIDARYAAWVCTTRWRLPLLSSEQVEAYGRDNPHAK